PNGYDQLTEGSAYGSGDDAEKRGDIVIQEVVGDFGPKSAEKVAAGRVRQG
ncbi:hypothetical protein U1Q18_014269, partial [Sarracenia purpurea var. burkii]